MSNRTRVVIAGGTGFVGRHLVARLKERFDVVVLSRRSPPIQREDGVRFERCDLFSLLDLERSLAGADYAVYLVHSMLPTSRLTQANFADQDIIVADNFARAARGAGVKQIVYLGGLLPQGDAISQHLRSRREVETVLAARGTPLTAVRAGLIVGADGSSFQMLLRLVRRLPVMICPRWTTNVSQPVGLGEVLDTLESSLGDSTRFGRALPVGSSDRPSYLDMMRTTARVLGRPLFLFVVPFNSYFLSRLWVRLFSGAPITLVAPLVESMKHPMLAEPNFIESSAGTFEASLRTALEAGSRLPSEPERRARPRTAVPERLNEVRSIQRMSLPPGKDARWAIVRYGLWLDASPGLTVRFDRRARKLVFKALGMTLLELTLSGERSSPDRRLYYITGGVLLAENPGRGRLEFRSFPENDILITAIHEFRPRLPWFIYNLSQAPVHLLVMKAFTRHLERYTMLKLRRRLQRGRGT